LALSVLRWGLGPIVILAVASGFGHRHAVGRGRLFDATASLSRAELGALESAPALAVANATWALGNEDSLRAMFRTELDRLPDSEILHRGRVFLRFGIIDSNPDGQAALFAQACVADASLCDHMKEAAEREVKARFAAPGNMLPLYFVGGHPRIPGPR
jgi:hypothetical protein